MMHNVSGAAAAVSSVMRDGVMIRRVPMTTRYQNDQSNIERVAGAIRAIAAVANKETWPNALGCRRRWTLSVCLCCLNE
jgi:hypothetical protein